MMNSQLTDAQWCVLDLLMRARQRGVVEINRMELLTSASLSDEAKIKLVFAALTIPTELVEIRNQHNFRITEAGVQLYNTRFGHGRNPEPTRVADAIIYLPDRSQETADA